MRCVTCRAELNVGDKACEACGTRVRPSYLRPLIYAAVLAVLGLGLNAAVRRVDALAKERGAYEVAKDSAPGTPKRRNTSTTVVSPTTVAGPKTTTTVPPTPQPIIPVSAEASSVADPAQNGCGQSTSYDASQILDGDPNTAWRAVGDGKNVKITLTLVKAQRVTQVGLIPGYDKTDLCTGIDRFVQMRRIKKVRWTFDDGTTIDQSFNDERSSQAIDVSAISAHITLEILATTTARELNYTGISDVHISGVPA